MSRRRPTNRRRLRSRVERLGIQPTLVVLRARGWFSRMRPYLVTTLVLTALPVVTFKGYQYFSNSAHFTLRNVEVEGLVEVSREEIMAFAGVSEGSRALEIDVSQVRADVQRHPRVRHADVDVDLPSTIRIKVDERRAAAVVVLGKLYLADERGVVFKAVDPEDELIGLPFIIIVSAISWHFVEKPSLKFKVRRIE